MIFIFKHKPVNLDLFTCRQMIYDAAKPKPAAQFYPDWWKELKTEIPLQGSMFPSATMRRCMGFVDYYKHGIIQPLWSDFICRTGPIGDPFFEASFSDNTTHVSQHPQMLRGSYLPDTHYCHIKMSNPWAAKCKEDIMWMWEQPTWSYPRPNDMVLLPGTTEFKYQYSLNVNIMFARGDTPIEHKMMFQQPLVHLTPLTERPFKLHYHMVAREEYDKLMQGEKLSNINRYRAYRRVRESEEKKCPFGGWMSQ
jgi:hypothetical protein